VGGYTWQLSQALCRRCEVTLLTSHRLEITPVPGLTITQPFDGQDPRTLFRIVPELERLRPDWLLVQWDPYSYGARYTFNPYLPLALGVLKRKLPGLRIAVIVHETFVPATDLKHTLITAWQRLQLRVLGELADVLVFVIEAWSKRLKSWFPRARVLHLPVGNTIPRVEVDRARLRGELGLPSDALILGWFGRAQPSRNVESIHHAIAGAKRAGANPFVLHIGVGAGLAKEALRDVPQSKVVGTLPADGISRHLSAMDIYLAPINEGVSSRNTSVMAAFAHGLAVIGTAGESTDRIFHEHRDRALLLVDGGKREGFEAAAQRLSESAALRQSLGQAAERLVAEHFSWDAISERLLTALDTAPDRSKRRDVFARSV
jgi:glycosyltransferase involved in cell wall biosynthesis